MNARSMRFQCPSCSARIKAPLALAGRRRDCPGCRRTLTVPGLRRPDATPILVLIEGEERCSLGIAYRRGA